jgi:hypothetical protein
MSCYVLFCYISAIQTIFFSFFPININKTQIGTENLFIGKKITVEFFERSEYGIPRFPIGKGFRNDIK